MGAAVDHVQHRHRQRRRALAAEIAVERLRPPRRPPPSRPRARRRGSRSRRAAPCSACRRARSASGRAPPGRARRAPASSPAISPLTFATAFVTPLPPHSEPPSRSSTASCTPVDAPDGTAARPTAPDASSTSTSTVGLPRESRIWRPCTRAIALIAVAPLPGRSSGPAPRAAARSSARPRLGGELLGALDPRDEARVRAAQRELRIDVQPPREVDDREEDVADLVRDLGVGLGLRARLARARDLGLELAELLAHLRERALEVGPVEAGGDRAPLQLPRLQERRQRRGHVVEDPLPALLLGLDLLPALADAAGGVGLDLAEDVRMPADELRVHGARDLLEVALALLLEQQRRGSRPGRGGRRARRAAWPGSPASAASATS